MNGHNSGGTLKTESAGVRTNKRGANVMKRVRFVALFLAIAIVGCLMPVAVAAATTTATVYVNGTRVQNPDAIVDQAGEILLPSGVSSARTIFPSNANWSNVGNSTEPVALKFIAPLLGYEFSQSGSTAYLSNGLSPEPPDTSVSIYINGTWISGADVILNSSNEMILPRGINSARTVFPSDADWSKVSNSTSSVALKFVAEMLGYSFRQDGNVAYLEKQQPIVVIGIVYLNGTRVQNADVIVESNGELMLPRGITSARTIFPTNANWSAVPNNTNSVTLRLTAEKLGYSFRQDGNTAYLTVTTTPAVVMLNGSRVTNADAIINTSGQATLPNGITSAKTIFPADADWQKVTNSNNSIALATVAQQLGYLVRQQNNTVYLTGGISNVSVQFRRNDIAIAVPYTTSNGKIVVTRAILLQTFENEIGNTALPDGEYFDFVKYAEYFGYTVTRYANILWFRNDSLKPMLVEVNGELILFQDQQPIVKSGRTLVPIAPLTAALGGSSSWDGTRRLATITYGTKNVQVYIGQTTYYINSNPYRLDVPAEIIGGRTMIPLRAVSEALGYTVTWDPGTSIDWIRLR